MSEMKDYVDSVLELIKKRDPDQVEFHNTVKEVLTSIIPFLEKNPKYKEEKMLERMVEPERVVTFRVVWQDDKNVTHINRGYRVQMNSAIGPYKGGLRFHPSVNLSILKFLAFEQVFKNSLTSLPIGGGKGGYLFGQYKRIRDAYDSAVLTGKGLTYGGSLTRTEATGYGLLYFVKNMLDAKGISLKDKIVSVSGSGNVATYAIEKAQEFGAKVVTCSDSNGYIYDPDGIDLVTVKRIKEVERGRISEYEEVHPNSVYHEGCRGIWDVKCDIALPCATQSELDLESAKKLVDNGCTVVGEGANMPSTLDAIEYFLRKKILFAPAKAANAGGVAVSALEMSQNSERLHWTFEQVDEKLKDIMANIYKNAKKNAEEFGDPDNLVMGANIAGFKKVAEAMSAQGIV